MEIPSKLLCSFFESIQFNVGGGSTHLQAISAESRKYFRNAIAMSGSAVHFWSLSSIQNNIEYAFELASSWGKAPANLNELIDVLKTISADKFIEYSSLASKIGRIFEIPNGPVIEGKQHKQCQFH